jgi:hypothetical protein
LDHLDLVSFARNVSNFVDGLLQSFRGMLSKARFSQRRYSEVIEAVSVVKRGMGRT